MTGFIFPWANMCSIATPNKMKKANVVKFPGVIWYPLASRPVIESIVPPFVMLLIPASGSFCDARVLRYFGLVRLMAAYLAKFFFTAVLSILFDLKSRIYNYKKFNMNLITSVCGNYYN